MSAPLFEPFRPNREVSEAAARALKAGIPVKVRKGVAFVYVNEATADYLDSPHVEVLVGPVCRCLSFRLAHEPSRHDELRADFDWRTWEERKDFGGEVHESRRMKSLPQDVDQVLEEWSA